MKHLVEKIANKEYDSAKSIFENRMFDLVEKKLLEAKKATGAKMMEQSMGQVGPTVPEKRKTGVIEQAVLSPSGEADADRVRDIIRSKMKAASPGQAVGPSASSVGGSKNAVPKTTTPYKVSKPISGPSIPANAKQFALPKVGEPPKAANVNRGASWVEKGMAKVAPYASKVGRFLANPVIGTAQMALEPSTTNAGEPDYVKQNVEKQIQKDTASAEKSIKLAKQPIKDKSFETSKAAGPAQSTKAEPMKMPNVRPTSAPETMKMPDVRPTSAPETMKMPDVRPTKATEPPSVTRPPQPVTPTPKTAAPAKQDNYDDLSFPVAFSRAREAAAKLSPAERGNYNFKWRGNDYQTNIKDKEAYIPQSQQKGTVGTDVGPSAYEKKLAKMSPEAAKADIRSQTPKKYQAEIQEEVELDEARIKIVKARIRGGKIQRRKKVSNVPGMTIRGGKLTRMSPAERRRRRLGQKRGKVKRRAKLSRTLMKRSRSLRKRKSLGL